MKQRACPSGRRVFLAAILRFTFLSLTVFATADTELFAQSATGQIIGNVSDPAGARIAGAKVEAISVQTGSRSATTTKADGSYQVLDLPIGSYKISVSQPGFETAVTKPDNLQINQTLRMDVSLTLGAVSQVVSVETRASQVETAVPTIGATVSGSLLQEMPLNGRDPMTLLNTQAGYVGGTIAGGRTDNVTYLLDGGNNNTVRSALINYDPNPDTVSEFRVLMNNYTAEFGRSGGGVVSVVTKSGTNQLHGSLYDYLRNTDLNANDYFLNMQGSPRANLQRNQFGGSIGGPVIIPKLIHGKDKLFFFFAYQGQRQVQTAVGSLSTVYTPAELNGDFSQASNGKPDKNVVAFLQQYPYYQANPSLASRGIIDPTKLDPIFLNLAKAGLTASSPSGTLVPQSRTVTNNDQYTGKGDYNPTERDRISLTLGYQRNPSTNAGNYLFPTLNYSSTGFANLNYTKTITPSLINDFHAAANRLWQEQNIPGVQTPTPSQLGMQIASDAPDAIPYISMPSGFLSLGFNGNESKLADNTYAYNDTITWVKGKHTFKGGATMTWAQENSTYNYYVNGWFQYAGSSTTLGSGNPLADLAMGLPDNYQQYPSASNTLRQKQFGAFFQDEWKVTQRLLLTLGLRYEYSTPQTEGAGRTYSIVPGAQSQRFTGAPVGLIFPGDTGAPSGAYFPDKNNFAPRIGFAWDPFGKGRTSIRGGGGIFYNILNGWVLDEDNGLAPFYSTAYVSSNGGNPLPTGATGPFNYMVNPYASNGAPDPFPSRPLLSSKDPNLFSSQGYLPFGDTEWFVDPHLRTPYIYQYNLSVQQQLAKDLVAEVGYVGSSSHKLTTMMDINPMILGTNTRILNAGIYPYYTSQGSLTNDGYGALYNTVVNDGSASYNGLLASLNKRMGDWHGFGASFFTAAYTWSHNIDNGSGSITATGGTADVSYYDHDATRGNSLLDRRQRFTFSAGWELPFAHLFPGAPKKLTSGWTLYPIFTAQSGPYFSISARLSENGPVDNLVGPSGAGDAQLARAQLTTSAVQLYNQAQAQTITVGGVARTGLYYFNPNDFTVPANWKKTSYVPNAAQYTYGMPVNSILGPGTLNLDLAIAKRTALFQERVQTEFRIEAFNALNHTSLTGLNTSYGNALFGQATSDAGPRIVQMALRINF